jgi:hypothetical protein
MAAIKAEACPYTEVAPFTRRLGAFDAELREEAEAQAAGALAMTADGGSGASGGEEAAEAAEAGSGSARRHGGHSHSQAAHSGRSTGGSSSSSAPGGDLSMLRNEVPLMLGLRFHLTVYHPHRPLKAALAEAVAAYIAAGPSPSPSTPGQAAPLHVPVPAALPAGGALLDADEDASAFAAGWDALQARAAAFVEVALTTDAPLTASPAHIALAALAAAARPTAVVAEAAAPVPGGEGGEGEAAAPLWPALAAPPPASVAWFVHPYLAAKLGAAGGLAATEALADELVAAAASAHGLLRLSPAAAPLLRRLLALRDLSLQPGTPEHAARLAAVRADRAAYKAEKAAHAKAATAVYVATAVELAEAVVVVEEG